MSAPTAVGCHVYAGGHTLGVKQAGFDAPLHLEEGPFGVETSRRNLGVEVRVGLAEWHAAELEGLVDWLYGNPPCAAWSTLGIGAKVRGEASGYVRCTERLFDLMSVVRPRVFSWESVCPALVAGRGFVRKMVARVHALGYDAHGVVFDAADCGLPSHRRRFFFVASLVQLEFERPSERRVTAGEAWAAMAAAGYDTGPGRTSGNEVKLLETMPRGFGRVREHAARVGSKLRPFASRRRLGMDRVAPTIAGGADYYHPDEPRYLTVREQQVLAGYPPDYEFVGSLHQRYAQIGKAVTPPAAWWLGRQVRCGLEMAVPVGRSRRSLFWDFLHDRPKVGGADSWWEVIS